MSGHWERGRGLGLLDDDQRGRSRSGGVHSLLLAAALGLAAPWALEAEVAGIPGLYNTGVDPSGDPLPAGAADPHYRIVLSPNAQYGPEAYRFDGWPTAGPWIPNADSGASRWIAPASAGPDNWFPGGTYEYETTFELEEAALETVRIEGRWASDDSGSSRIFINGNPVPDSGNAGFQEWREFAVKDGFVRGINRLGFRFSNGNDSPTGLRVEMNGEAVEREAFPFFSSIGAEFDEPLNRMWRLFGSATELRNGQPVVVRFGNEPAFFEWIARKIMWSDEMNYRQGLVNRVTHFPMSENGYVWSWSTRPDWPTSPGALHQENNAKYILSVYRIVMWTRESAFLGQVDTTTRVPVSESSFPDEVDVSEGMTILEKLRAAMGYQLDALGGRDGLLVIDNGHNTGLPNGAPTNYWDNFPFGYKDAYSNIYFYASLRAMSEIEALIGNELESENHAAFAAKVKRRFTEEFWDLRKGRFVGTIDRNGRTWDLGFTFLNTEALAYGLGEDWQAEEIFAWLDGERIVESDTSTGGDIYTFRWAPRATTVDVATLGLPYWWKSIDNQITVGPGGSATFGEHLENGGAIFYTSHYDLMARALRRGPEDAWERFGAIMDEFAVDELLRNPPNNVGARWKFGIITVFPESGLVPASYLYVFLGIDATARGLEVRPNLPGNLAYGGVHRLSFNGGFYQVTVGDDWFEAKATHQGARQLVGVLGNLTPGRTYRKIVEPAGGEPVETAVTAADSGEIEFDLSVSGGDTVRLVPATE